MGKKDPNKPKGKKTAYQYFLDKERDTIKQQGGKIDFAEFSRNAADKWKSLDDDDKKEFNKKSAKDKIRYENEMANYSPPSDDSDDEPKKKKKKKDPNAPKKAQSAYFQFAGCKRAKLKEDDPSLSVTSIAKELGRQWGLLSAKEKEPYEEMARKDKARYEKAMREYTGDC